MPSQNVEQGIAAIQAGRVDEGARLLKIALGEPDVTGTLRAIACLWLAETSADQQSRKTYYTQALDADPGNAQVRQRYDAWMTTQLMPPTQPPAPPQTVPMPPSAPPPQPTALPGAGTLFQPQTLPGQSSSFAPTQPNPYAPATTPQPGSIGPVIQPPTASANYRIAAVIGGPNGTGTAFFVAREGLLATTRYVVGGLDQLTIQLETGRQLPGYVIRAFPELDLAFIYIEQATTDLIPVTPLPSVPDDVSLTIVSASGQTARGKQRKTKRTLGPQWFPTDITTLPDAGGCPVLDDRHYLVGMITRNTTSTSSYVFGLHINVIRQFVETFRQETLSGSRVYCPHCGCYSQAAASGGYYCEVCGGITPQAEQLVRFRQPQTDRFYQEFSNFTCMYCGATVGAHKSACLRCGRTPPK
jgi:hypothetical protein